MKKLLENERSDEIKKNLFLVSSLSILITLVLMITRIEEKAVFTIGFIIEAAFVFIVLRFYARAMRNRNYAFWGLSLILGVYLLMNLLQYTFIQYDSVVIYLSVLSSVFLIMNAYLLSSPLYFPRIQWWEYDFRYRGDIKAQIIFDDSKHDIRISDVRRGCISFFSFDQIRLDEEVELEIPFEEKVFLVKGKLKTAREDVLGRPVRYGLKLKLSNDDAKKEYTKLQKIWNVQNKAKIRRKFRDYEESNKV